MRHFGKVRVSVVPAPPSAECKISYRKIKPVHGSLSKSAIIENSRVAALAKFRVHYLRCVKWKTSSREETWLAIKVRSTIKKDMYCYLSKAKGPSSSMCNAFNA